MKSRLLTAIGGRGTFLVVSLVFLVLAVSLQALVWLYWDRILEPRLEREAASQANLLAHSQAVRLSEALLIEQPEQRRSVLQETMAEILLLTGPRKDRPVFLGLSLEVDYDVIAAPPRSLDLVGGTMDRKAGFASDVALYSLHSDELVGIARFLVSDSLFKHLSKDVKHTLFLQSWIGTLLLALVWLVIMVTIREINLARTQAELANHTKSAFLANMSHELRTPLNAIIGFSELMNRDQDLTAGQRENLLIINRSGNYLLELINDVLELSRIEAMPNTVTEAPFDLYETLEQVVQMLRPKVEKKQLQFIFERSDDLPRYIVSDERKLRQVLLNLLGNAVKFTDRGGVVLRARHLAGAPRRDGLGSLTLQFEVEDTGPGITREEQPQIFEAFTQAQRGRAKREGTGLGLTISRQFVNQLGGEIQVRSTVGRGTVFSFTIQARPGEASAVSPPRQTRKVVGLRPGSAGDEGEALRILVVDDHQENRALLRLLLEQVGIAVRTAVNGREAVDLDESWRPHFIWMDIRMPEMDGYKATRAIREARAARGQDQPVIVALTASAFQEDRHAVTAAGCDDFVRRPYFESEIWDKLQQHLGVELVYEDQDPEAAGEALDEASITAGLAAISAETRARLSEAVVEVDFDAAMEIINSIAEGNAPLAGYLADLVNKYHFDILQKHLEQWKT